MLNLEFVPSHSAARAPAGSFSFAHAPVLTHEAPRRDHDALRRTVRWSRAELEVHAHRRALRAVALRLVADHADAEDLVQDTLERGLRRLDALPAHANVRGWLITILRHLFIDGTRSRRRHPTPLPITPDADVPAPAPAPEPAWTHITDLQLREAVARLEPEFRRVYELHAFEHRSYQEIAVELALPTSTVGTRLHRARRKLRGLLAR